MELDETGKHVKVKCRQKRSSDLEYIDDEDLEIMVEKDERFPRATGRKNPPRAAALQVKQMLTDSDSEEETKLLTVKLDRKRKPKSDSEYVDEEEDDEEVPNKPSRKHKKGVTREVKAESQSEGSDDEDELEIVLGEHDNTIAAEELRKLVSIKDELDLTCVICDNGKKMTPQQLEKHYKKHEQLWADLTYGKKRDEEPQYYCHICKDDRAMTKNDLRNHYQNIHDLAITNPKQFFRRARSKRPRLPRPEVYRCEICSEQFANQKELDKHIRNHDDQYSCDICNTGFKKLIDYTFHIQIHSEDKMYKCPLCQFETDKSYLVKSHLYSVHEQFKKYKCEVCSKGFAIFTHFQEHKYFHSGEKPFECDVCGQKFMYTRYLNSHKVQMHIRKESDGITCKICQKVYSHRNSLNTHMRSHTGAKSVCDVCGKTFSSNEKLRLHYRIHTGEKPYKCDYCDKTFKTSSYRTEHERIHTGEKPYECPYCGKGFSQRTSMVIHSRGHTGEKPYQCHLCNKGFAAKSMVTIHLKSCKGGMIHRIDDD